MTGSGWRAHEAWAVSVSRARQFGPRGIVDREDLEQVARIAVWRAWRAWRADSGVPFHSFAVRRIEGAILQAYRDTSGVAPKAWEEGVRLSTEPFEEDLHDSMAVDPGYAAVETAAVLDVLSGRSRAVAYAMARGLTVSEAAMELGCSIRYSIRLRRQVARAVLAMVTGQEMHHGTRGRL